MRIAFLLPSLDAKGPEFFTDNLIRGLMNEGCICEVFYFNNSSSPIFFSVKCTKISFRKLYSFSDFDIVHTTMAKPDIYMALHKKKIKAQWVSGIHCFMKEDLRQSHGALKTALYSWMWIHALSKAENIIVSSAPMLCYYKNLLCSIDLSWEIIPYGIPERKVEEIDTATKEKLLAIKSRYSVLMGCGLLIKRKGFYQLINYLQHNEKVAVILIGDGECMEDLVAQAKRLNVSERLFFLGFRSNSMNYYPYSDIYCMSSNSEGFGLAMLEALSLGMPLVCSDLDIYKDYFSHRDVSLFRFGDQNSFNYAVNEVLLNKEQYAQNSLRLFNEHFSLKSMSKRHVDFYKKLLR